MKTLLKPILTAGLLMTASAGLAAAPAAAQQAVQGIAVVNLPAAMANSNAYKVAEQQRTVTYKATFDQATTRRDQLQAQLKPMYDKFQADQKAKVATATLQQEAQQIQQIEEAGKRELNQLVQPIAMSRAYVQEQLEDKLDDAVKIAAKNKNVTLILDASNGGVVFAAAEYNITQEVINQLNTLIPNAQLVPPQGWLPREARQQQEAAQAAQADQGRTAPAPQQPSGR